MAREDGAVVLDARDLLVNISIYVPEALNKEEKSTLEKMEASDNFKPNTSVKEKIFKKFKSFFD